MKKVFLFLAAAAMACISCNLDEVLTTVPESQLSAESYFKTAEDLQLFSNTFYNNLLEKEPFSANSLMRQVISR